MHTQIEPLTAADHQAWLDFIEDHPHASAYQHPAWLQAIEQAYGHKGWLVSAWEEGALMGVLPVCQLRRPAGDSMVSLPFCDYAGPLARNEAAQTALTDGARQLLSYLRLGGLEIRRQGQFLDEATTGQLEQSENPVKVSLLADLPETPEALFAGFRTKLRSQIRKAEKNGLTVSVENSPESLERFYPVFAANMRRLGSPVHGKNWFLALQQAFGPQMLVGLVRLDNTVVAAGIVLVQGQRACIPWASTLPGYNHLAANMLLYWQLLSRVTELGCRQFDFGRSTPGEGTYRFKRQWGARPVELLWQNWLADGRVVAADSATPGVFAKHFRQLIEACWQRLPLALANRLGPRLRKHISL